MAAFLELRADPVFTLDLMDTNKKKRHGQDPVKKLMLHPEKQVRLGGRTVSTGLQSVSLTVQEREPVPRMLSIRTSVASSQRISPGHFLKVFQIRPTLLSLLANAAFLVEALMAGLLLSICHNQHRGSLRATDHLYQSNEVVLFLNVLPELYADQGENG